MEILKIMNLSFQFPDMNKEVLSEISLDVIEGEFLVIGGPSGCGKTTLLRLLKKELAPVGTCKGEILYKGKPLEKWDERALLEEIGFVFQDPDNQIVMDDVMQELVFGLENLGYSTNEMRKRVAEMVHFFGIENVLTEKASQLSGGQKQLLNLVSVLLLKPKVLLLDEPTSQLDPIAARDLIRMLERLNKEMGITIILVEHRLEELFAIADRVLLMKEGRIRHEGMSQGLIQSLYLAKEEQFIPYTPSIARLYMETEHPFTNTTIPLTVKDGRSWLRTLSTDLYNKLDEADQNEKQLPEPILSAENVFFQYDKKSPLILKDFSVDVRKGEFFTLVGGNGSGKTTVLKACIGLLKLQRGNIRLFGEKTNQRKKIRIHEKIAYLPQNPRSFFMFDQIEKELLDVIERKNVENGSEKMAEIVEVFEISHLLRKHPYDCSGGEIQKIALACMLLGGPELLFIDEPTKGLDPISKQKFGELLRTLHKEGLTIVLVTHDIEFAAKYADRCAMMFDGRITVDGTPGELFKGNYFYTTAINRVTRESHMPDVLTLEEAFIKWPVC